MRLYPCSDDIEQLADRKYVYHVTPKEEKSLVAKVVATPYPCQLHQELSNLGLTPKLVVPVEEYPGRVQEIKMEYFGPTDLDASKALRWRLGCSTCSGNGGP